MLRVFLVDDHGVFRSGVRAELAGESDIEIVGEAGSVVEAVAGIRSSAPDVVLLDVHMPSGGGVAVINGTIGLVCPVFLALSVSDAAEDVIAVIRAGARGYVTKTISGSELADAVRRVAGGDAVFSPRLAGFVLDSFTGRSNAPEPALDPELDSLTPRELEVLRLQIGRAIHLPRDRRGFGDLGEDGGDSRLQCATQDPAVQPQRIDALGPYPPARLTLGPPHAVLWRTCANPPQCGVSADSFCSHLLP